jgi:DNA-directed RNA polymerase specialized sigma54-like protein
MERDWNTQILKAEQQSAHEIIEIFEGSNQRIMKLLAKFVEKAKQFRKSEKVQVRPIREKCVSAEMCYH